MRRLVVAPLSALCVVVWSLAALGQGQGPLRGQPVFAADSTPGEADVERLLVGTWTIQVGNQERTRTLEIRDLKQEGKEFVAESVYGYTGGNPKPIPMRVVVERGVVSMDLTSPAGSRIEARSLGPGHFAGYMQTEQGRRFRAILTLTPEEDVKLPPGQRGKQITLVYVSANNCPTCQRWSGGAKGAGPAKSKRDFLEMAEGKAITFRQIDAPNYMDTAYDPAWPADLKWVKEQTNVRSGTPRFILIVDGKIVTNARRTGSLPEKIMPKIRQLAGLAS
ncbi:MAG: hypothetical protein HY521_09955 [Proteobacteria bacterium]|nr:hypothetical protein [Pseudomonadota bacterium]